MPWTLRPTVKLIPTLPFVAFGIAVLIDYLNKRFPGSIIDPRLHWAVIWPLIAFNLASMAFALSLSGLKGREYADATENQKTCLMAGAAAGVAMAVYLLRDEIMCAVSDGYL